MPSDARRIDDVDRLLEVLEAELTCHRQLAARLYDKQAAVRGADIGRITLLCEGEHELLARITELQNLRRSLLGRLSSTGQPTSIPALAADLDAPRRERLEEVGDALRREIEQVRHAGSVVAAAAAALSRHVTGIVAAVNSALSRAGVYERKGRIAATAQIDFCVDLKS